MVEPAFGPADIVVALLALRAVTPFMHIVIPVASIACLRQLLLLGKRRFGRPGMALSASQLRVAAFETKAAVTRVVKARGLPRRGLMAAVTASTKAASMHVINSVATTAILWCVLVVGTAVTLRARGLFVRASERELCLAMVERCLAPLQFAVAALALLALRALVHIIIAVTVDATTGRFAKRLACCMALAAGQHGMTALKLKIRKIMHKGILVELQDIGTAPLVFGVTKLALRCLDTRLATMKASAVVDIGCHRLVAGKT